MRALIIEDEKLTAERLADLLIKDLPQVELAGMLHSVESAKRWLSKEPEPDLIFVDIELGDGTAFDLLEAQKISSAIIFTTAFDIHAVKAFKYNSVDYLLKPIDPKELKKAVEKYERGNLADQEPVLEELKRFFNSGFKKRFMVKSGDKLQSIPVEDVNYFFSEDSYTFLLDKEEKKWIIDYSLDDLDEILDPLSFFRLNRRIISNIDSIDTVSSYFNGRLVVKVLPEMNEQIVISRERVKSFKAWLDG
jgi:two-component system, LytTR family, response regulator